MAFSRARLVFLFAAGWGLMMSSAFAVMFTGTVSRELGSPGRALSFTMSFLVLAAIFYVVNVVSALSVLFFGKDARRIVDFRASNIAVLVFSAVFILTSPFRFFVTTGDWSGLDGPLVVAVFATFVVLMNSLFIRTLRGSVIEAAAFSTLSLVGAGAIVFVWMKSIMNAFGGMAFTALILSVLAFGFAGVCLFKMASAYYAMAMQLADLRCDLSKPVSIDGSADPLDGDSLS